MSFYNFNHQHKLIYLSSDMVHSLPIYTCWRGIKNRNVLACTFVHTKVAAYLLLKCKSFKCYEFIMNFSIYNSGNRISIQIEETCLFEREVKIKCLQADDF